jgi:hypothetical protein
LEQLKAAFEVLGVVQRFDVDQGYEETGFDVVSLRCLPSIHLGVLGCVAIEVLQPHSYLLSFIKAAIVCIARGTLTSVVLPELDAGQDAPRIGNNELFKELPALC